MTHVDGRVRRLVVPLVGHAVLATILLCVAWGLLLTSDTILRPEAPPFHLDPSDAIRVWVLILVGSVLYDALLAQVGHGTFFGSRRAAAVPEVAAGPVATSAPTGTAVAPASTWGSAWVTADVAQARFDGPFSATWSAARRREVTEHLDRIGLLSPWAFVGAVVCFSVGSGRLALDVIDGRPGAWVPLAAAFLAALPVTDLVLWLLPEDEARASANVSKSPTGLADAAGEAIAAAIGYTVVAAVCGLIVVAVGILLWAVVPAVVLAVSGLIAVILALGAVTALLRRGEARVARADPSLRSGAEEAREFSRVTRTWIARMTALRTSVELADHPAAERAAVDLYAASGFATPSILWARSPSEAAALLVAMGTQYRTRPPAGSSDAVPHPTQPDDGVAVAATVADAWRILRFQALEVQTGGSVRWDPSGAGIVGMRLPGIPGGYSPAFALEDARETRRLAYADLAVGAGTRRLSRADDALITLMETTGGWWCTADAVVLCERPVARAAGPGRPGEPVRSTVRYADGAWLIAPSGRMASPREAHILDTADEMDPRTVASLVDADLREAVVARIGRDRYVETVATSADFIAVEPDRAIARAALAILGEERFVQEAGRVIDSDLDPAGRMRRLWYAQRRGDQPVVMIEVVNSTPAPDGSRSHHFLRVPSHMTRCGAAVAWTFGMQRDDYAPAAET